MTKAELKQYLQEHRMEEMLDIIAEAESGKLEELELVKSLGLLRDENLNEEVLTLLKEEGVNIIYVKNEE